MGRCHVSNLGFWKNWTAVEALTAAILAIGRFSDLVRKRLNRILYRITQEPFFNSLEINAMETMGTRL